MLFRSIFYDRAGSARSTGEVYAKLTGLFESARAVNFAPGVRPAERAAPAGPSSPDTAGVTLAFAQANRDARPLPDTRPLFQAMFTDRARAAVTQTISSLWAPAKNETPSKAEPARPLDLFTDRATDTRKIFRGNS